MIICFLKLCVLFILCRFCLFFQGKSNSSKQVELRKIVREFGHNDLVITYRGIQSAVLRTSCVIHDDDTAFEVFRNGHEVGANVTTSGVIAVVPKRLVLKLIEENGGVPEEVRGVTVTGIDGLLRCSSDGDFIIRQSRPNGGEADLADIVCSTGNSSSDFLQFLLKKIFTSRMKSNFLREQYFLFY